MIDTNARFVDLEEETETPSSTALRQTPQPSSQSAVRKRGPPTIVDSINQLTQPPKRCLRPRKSDGATAPSQTGTRDTHGSSQSDIGPSPLASIISHPEAISSANPSLHILASVRGTLSIEALKSAIMQRYLDDQINGEPHEPTREYLMRTMFRIIEESKSKELQSSSELPRSQEQLRKPQADAADGKHECSEAMDLKNELQRAKVQLRIAEGKLRIAQWKLVKLKNRIMGLIEEGVDGWEI